MALSGSFNTSSNSGRYMTFSWSASQSISNNTSTISWSLTGAGNSGWVVCSQLKVVIDGETVATRSSSDHMDVYPGTVFASGSKTITHNSDGSRSFSVSVDVGIYQWAYNCSGSGTWTLNTIARASQPSCVTYPNNTQNVGNIGGSFMIHMNRKSTAFTHTVKYAFGNASGTIATGVGDNTTWTIPNTLANQIPSAISGTGTITVDTYNGGTKIGTKTCSFTCSVPSTFIPTVNSVSAVIVNSNSVINGWNIAVAGYTKVTVTASASGSYGSSISSFTITGGYSTSQTGSSLSYTGDAISTSGSKTFTVTAKDSRGRTSTAVISSAITFYSYSKPTISLITADRTTTDATKIQVKANWTYSTVNNNNSCTATLKYKKSTQSGWTTYGAISKNTNVILSVTFEEISSYNFLVVVTDSLSNSAQDETFISTIEVLLDFRAGGKGLGIGKIAESDNMEVALDTIFIGDVYIKNGSTNVPLATYIQNIINGS